LIQTDLSGPKIEHGYLSNFSMKQIFYILRHKADLLLQNSTATRGRPLSFQIVVAALFTIDLIAFISFCVMKLISG
jgi:hypothetical protein